MSFSKQALKPQHILFYYMHEIVKQAKTIKPKAVFLVGDIRSGKSCTFNWKVNPSYLIGVGNQDDTRYEVCANVKQQLTAKVDESYKSVTLIPNIINLAQRQGEISFVDLPGFKENRTENEVMLINFIFNSCFVQTTDAKFILVISDLGFRSVNGNQFIKTFVQFIKMFDFGSADDALRKSFYKSVGILITSVDVEQNSESSNSFFNKRLKKNLKKFKQLNEQNHYYDHIFTYLDEMITDIIENGRIDIFPQAKLNKHPSKCDIFDKFKNKGWTCFNMKRQIQPKLEIAYSEQFKMLTEEQQLNIKRTITLKIHSFQELCILFSNFIKKFLQKPIDQYMDFQKEFKLLGQFIKLHTVHGDVPSFDQEREHENIENGLRVMSIIKNIIALKNTNVEYYADWNERQQNKSYYQYLKGLMINTIGKMRESFCTTLDQKNIMNALQYIFCELLQHLQMLRAIDSEIVSDCYVKIKDSGISVMNLIDITEYQIIHAFFRQLNNEDTNLAITFELNELVQIMEFAQLTKDQQIDIKIKYCLLFKLNRNIYLKMEEQSNSQHYDPYLKKHYLMQSLLDLIIYQFIVQLGNANKDIEQTVAKQLQFQKIQINKQRQIILLDICLNFEEESNEPNCAIVRIYQEFNIVTALIQYFSTKAKDKKNNNAIEWKKKLAATLLKYGRNKQAKNIYQELEKQKYIRKQKQLLAQIQTGKKEAEQLASTQVIAREQMARLIQEKAMDKLNLLKFINKIRSYFFKDINQLTGQIFEQIKKRFTQKIQNQIIASQFTIQLPSPINNHQILMYTQYLITRINKRRVTIILGPRGSGKTTTSYWLRSKSLQIKQSNDKLIYDLSKSSRQQNHINHNANPTLVPNIYSIKENQLMIDTAGCDQKDPEMMLITRHILKQIIKNSGDCRILLVIKEDDLLKKEGVQFMSLLRLCQDLFDFNSILNSIKVVFTFVHKQQIVKESIKQLLQLLKNKQKYQLIQQRYDVQPKQIQSFIQLMTLIFLNGKITYFNVPHKSDLDKCIVHKINEQDIEQQQKNWLFIKDSSSKLKNQIHHDFLSIKLDKHKLSIEQLAVRLNYLKTMIYKSTSTIQQQISTYYQKGKIEYSNSSDLCHNVFKPLLDQNMQLNSYADYILKKVGQNKHLVLPEFPHFTHERVQHSLYNYLSNYFIKITSLQLLANESSSIMIKTQFQKFINIIERCYIQLPYLICFNLEEQAILQKVRLITNSQIKCLHVLYSQIYSIKVDDLKPQHVELVGKYKQALSTITEMQHIINGFIPNFIDNVLEIMIYRIWDQLKSKQNKLNQKQFFETLQKALPTMLKVVNNKKQQTQGKLDDALKLFESFYQICRQMIKFNEQANKNIKIVNILMFAYQIKKIIVDVKKQNKSISKSQQNSQIIQINQIFGKIAQNIVSYNEPLAFQICYSLNNFDAHLKIFQSFKNTKPAGELNKMILNLLNKCIKQKKVGDWAFKMVILALQISQSRNNKTQLNILKQQLQKVNTNQSMYTQDTLTFDKFNTLSIKIRKFIQLQ